MDVHKIWGIFEILPDAPWDWYHSPTHYTQQTAHQIDNIVTEIHHLRDTMTDSVHHPNDTEDSE